MSRLAFGAFALAVMSACAPEPPTREAPDEPRAVEALARARELARVSAPALFQPIGRAPTPLERSSARFERDADAFVHTDTKGSVRLRSGGRIELTNGRGVTVGVTLPLAGDAPVEWAEGVAVYRGDAPTFLRRSAASVQDSTVVTSAAVHELVYPITLPSGARMAQTDRGLVVLADDGGLELRISDARVVDASGREVYAQLAIGGCDLGRSCQVVVSWSPSLRYPVFVDPTWTILDGWTRMWSQTDKTARPRLGHRAVRLSETQVLAVGGHLGDVPQSEFPSVPGAIFVFTLSGNTVQAENDGLVQAPSALRSRFPSVLRVATGDILITGGLGGTYSGDSLTPYIFDDTYSLDTSLKLTKLSSKSTARYAAAVGELGGCAYAIGGSDASFELNAVERFCPGAQKWEKVEVAPSQHERAFATATPVANGLFVVGGKPARPELLSLGTGSKLNAASIDWPGTCTKAACETFSSGTSLYHHSATALAGGKVFLSGGVHCVQLVPAANGLGFTCDPDPNAATSSKYTFVFDGTQLKPGPELQVARQQHASAALANGWVLVVGGQHCVKGACVPVPTDAVAELCNPAATDCEKLSAEVTGSGEKLSLARADLAATTLEQDRRVLVSFGQDEGGGDVSGEPGALFSLRDLGKACAAGFECVSGFCQDQLCCESACDGLCQSCNAAGKCGPSAAGTPDSACAEEGSECGHSGACDGNGACTLKLPEDAPCGTQATSCSGNDFVSKRCHARACESTVVSCKGAKCVATKGCSSEPCDCAVGYYCSDGHCLPKVAVGACSGDEACVSNHCVEGACCDTACDGACETCAGGTCRPRDVGFDSPLCEAALCSGSDGQCSSACNSAKDCKPSYTCSSSGKCVKAAEDEDDSGCGCRLTTSEPVGGSSGLLIGLLGLALRRGQRRPCRFRSL